MGLEDSEAQEFKVKITCHFEGPKVTEVIDIVDDWGMTEDATDNEIEEAVMDWASNICSIGWSRNDEEE